MEVQSLTHSAALSAVARNLSSRLQVAWIQAVHEQYLGESPGLAVQLQLDQHSAEQQKEVAPPNESSSEVVCLGLASAAPYRTCKRQPRQV